MEHVSSEPCNDPPIVLASGSPRRRALLSSLGLVFTIAPADIDETALEAEPPLAYGMRLAERKACAAAALVDEGLVIGADTIVVLEDEILGKPVDAAQAARYLGRLRCRAHHVITAVAIADADSRRVESGHTRSTVWMRAYTDDEVAAYIASGDPFDKAGAYAIQHPGFHPVERLEGSRTNVVGLPLGLLQDLLARFGVFVTKQTGPDSPETEAANRPAIH